MSNKADITIIGVGVIGLAYNKYNEEEN